MLIDQWMTKDVFTVTPDTSMMKASKLIKDKNVLHLPVVDDDGKLIGIVTDRDLKEASASKATALDVHELYYLLSEIQVKDIMTPQPVTITPEDTVEKAAAIMLEKKISALPVVDEHSKVLGIITDTDVFKVLTSITGIYRGGTQLGLKLSNEPGTLKPVLDDLRGHKVRIISILTAYEIPEPSFRQVYIRIHDMEKSQENKIKEEIKSKYDLVFWVRDSVHPG